MIIHFAIYMYILREKNKQHVKKYNLLQIFNIILNTEISITLHWHLAHWLFRLYSSLKCHNVRTTWAVFTRWFLTVCRYSSETWDFSCCFSCCHGPVSHVKYPDVALQNWRRVWFSDESRFMLQKRDGRTRVYRRQNERFTRNYVLEVDNFGRGSVMMWGGLVSA
jgi:hypothetical protein